MPEAEVEEEFEDISNASQFTGVPKLGVRPAILKGVPTRSGKSPRVLVHELTIREHEEMLAENRENPKHADINLLAWCTRDRNRNRLWHTADEANAQLGAWGLSYKGILQAAIDKVHGPTEDEAQGNSEGAPTS